MHLASRPLTSFVFAIACVIAISSAQAGLFNDNEARQAILELRAQRDKDQEAVSAMVKQLEQLSKNLLDTSHQVEVLRGEIARLRGQNDLLLKKQSELYEKQSFIETTVDERVRKLEPINITLDGESFQAAPQEAALFDHALSLMKQQKFAEALAQWDALLNQYPKSGYLGFIRYWQGNAHYGLGACKPAIQAFQSLLNLKPQHPLAAEAMLSIANCHSELKETKKAREWLQTLLRNFPDSEAAQVANEKLNRPPPSKPDAKKAK